MVKKIDLKGISLPVNLIIILTVAIIVMLVAVMLMFPWIWGPGRTITHSQAWSRGCMIWHQRGCRLEDIKNIIIENYNPDKVEGDNNLFDACKGYLGYTREEQCWRACCLLSEERREQQ